MKKEALYYTKLEDGQIRCNLCPFDCKLGKGELARCMGRTNIDGTFYATNYGKATSLSLDPIEKKPLFHFHPRSEILSVSANSCNLGCTFCQNWSISQVKSDTREYSSLDILSYAKEHSSLGLAYTYSEPLMWYEFVLDTSKLFKEHGFFNVLITNGTINKEPFIALLPYIDAINIDLKGFNSKFYKRVCKGFLEPVIDNIRLIKSMEGGPFLELTNLLIPGLNDSDEDILSLVDFVCNLDKDIPLHFSAYYPAYKLDLPRTTNETLVQAYNLASDKLNYVYVGNADIKGMSDTYCPNCSSVLIERRYYETKVLGLDGDSCSFCGEKIAVIV